MTGNQIAKLSQLLYRYAVAEGEACGAGPSEMAMAMFYACSSLVVSCRRPETSRQAAVRLLEPLLQSEIRRAASADFNEQPTAGQA